MDKITVALFEDKYIERLKKIDDDYDIEENHINADNILMELLKELGFDKLVKKYDKITKYYS